MTPEEKIEYLIKKEKECELFFDNLAKTIIGCFLVAITAIPILIFLFILLPKELQEQILLLLQWL